MESRMMRSLIGNRGLSGPEVILIPLSTYRVRKGEEHIDHFYKMYLVLGNI